MPHPRSPSLLSPANYDNDAASLRSPSEQDSDSDDDEFLRYPRSTLELSQHDRSVLDDEDELEKLLTRSGPAHGLRRIFSPNGNNVRIGKRERRRARREARLSRRERVSEEGELMYEMEEGLGDDETSSMMSGSSMDLDGKEDYLYEPVHIRGTLPWPSYPKSTDPRLASSALQAIMAQNSLRFRHHRRLIPYPLPRRIQSVQYLPSRTPACPVSTFQRQLAFCAYHYFDLTRRIPSRLPRPPSDPGPQFANCERRLPAVYDAQLS